MFEENKNKFSFPAGIPGLPENLKEFIIIALSKESPFFYLQSLQDENIGFILINPFAIYPDYEFDLSDEDMELMGLESSEGLAVFCIVNASKGLKNATVNLLAPVVLNIVTGVGRQIVLLDKRYTVSHPLTGVKGESPGGER